MRLILTHEQADFDALAALFAASLTEDGLAVLPRRLNRNLRAFINLYGTEFPFIDPRDLPQGPVEEVVLVDTQSLITLKGMDNNTKVAVFDHHPPRKQTPKNIARDYPSHWDVTTFELGATTTYFVEAIQARAKEITPLQATLMLLGIYEDTGSLTFFHTTARDVHAVAWLLEQGAELANVNDYLNPPLNPDQRELYERLLANSETIEINGHKIMLASAESASATDEVSTLAHKMRDLMDPEALFVLVLTPEGVRFVARSSTDQIDVSLVAAHFGGGGHTRAAAALIKMDDGKQLTLENVRKDLISVLPQYVRPSITVVQLMSRRPHVILAQDSVLLAARQMARYGYEGFPVMDDGRVVGLLTRRAVDRALIHKLNLPVASLMEAGNVEVNPGDSLQRLQTLMADSGWGQIPVVEPETNKLVGIVTRTDVLKILSRRQPQLPQYPNLAKRLREFLGTDTLALFQSVAEAAVAEHFPLYIVGGFVRDLLLSHPSTDFDIVVEGDAILLGKNLQRAFGGRLTSHTRFGTSRWVLAGSTFSGTGLPEFLDLISARQEFYEHPSALPIVEHSSIRHDLHRRDFTINTLALRLDGRHFGELHDYYGGQSDLERHIIRVLHSLSFIDDPTRLLRAVRYEQRYGFEIEARTLQLMSEARDLLAHLSPERTRHELDLIIAEKHGVEMLARLAELGYLKAISPNLLWNEEIFKRLKKFSRAEYPPGWQLKPNSTELLFYCLWLIDLTENELDQVQERLTFPVRFYKSIRSAAKLQALIPALQDSSPSVWVDQLEGLPPTVIYAVFLLNREPALEKYILDWQHIHPFTTGHFLRARGLTPGPRYQDVLHTLKVAWLDGRLTSREDEEALLNSLLSPEH